VIVMVKALTILGFVLAAAIVAGCAAPMAATRSVTLGSDVFGYHQYEGATLRFPEYSTVSGGGGAGVGFRSGLVLTIMTRNGNPVTESDRDAARQAARLLCETTSRRWYDQDPGAFLPSGGLSFAGACG